MTIPIVRYVRDNAPTSTIGWSVVTAWHTPWTPTVGTLTRQTAPSVGNERVFVCVVSGAVGGSEPSWGLTYGAKTTDSSATWVECTGQPGVNGDTTFTITTSATVSAGSLILPFSSTSGIQIGQYVGLVSDPSGLIILAYTTVKDIVTNSYIILSFAVHSGTVTGGSSITIGNTPTWLITQFDLTNQGLVITDIANTHLFIASTGGISANAGEPVWNTTTGATTVDGTVTFTCLGPTNTYSAWAGPHARIVSAMNTLGDEDGVGILYVADDHSETQASTITIPNIGRPTYCIDHTIMPPTPSSLKNGATVATTGTNNIIIELESYIYGVNFIAGSGASSGTSNITISTLGGTQPTTFDNCSFTLANSALVSSYINVNTTIVIWNNTTFSFAYTGHGISVNGGHVYWKNTPGTAVSGGGNLFKNCNGGVVNITGVNLGSVLLSDTSLVQLNVNNCNVNDIASGGAILATTSLADTSGTNYFFEQCIITNVQRAETVVVRSGGANIGSMPISSKLTLNNPNNSSFSYPFTMLPIAQWNNATGRNVTVTVYGMITMQNSLPYNDNIWLEVQYMGSSGSPIVSIATTGKTNIFSAVTKLTAETNSIWNNLVPARLNSTSYSVGNVISVATAPTAGQVFFCTLAGMSSGSVPGGYSTAVDGTLITDGSANFVAGMRFVLSVVLKSPQPQLTGPVYAIVTIANDNTFIQSPNSSVPLLYIDPLIILN